MRELYHECQQLKQTPARPNNRQNTNENGCVGAYVVNRMSLFLTRTYRSDKCSVWSWYCNNLSKSIQNSALTNKAY